MKVFDDYKKAKENCKNLELTNFKGCKNIYYVFEKVNDDIPNAEKMLEEINRGNKLFADRDPVNFIINMIVNDMFSQISEQNIDREITFSLMDVIDHYVYNEYWDTMEDILEMVVYDNYNYILNCIQRNKKVDTMTVHWIEAVPDDSVRRELVNIYWQYRYNNKFKATASQKIYTWWPIITLKLKD